MDARILQQVIELRRPWLDDLMVLASALGAGGFLWIVIGSIAGIFPRHTAAMWRLWLAVGLSFLIIDAFMKPFFARAVHASTWACIGRAMSSPFHVSFLTFRPQFKSIHDK